jgi:hypothetical protein
MVLGGLGRATDDSTDSGSSAQSERSLWTGVSIFVPARYILSILLTLYVYTSVYH